MFPNVLLRHGAGALTRHQCRRQTQRVPRRCLILGIETSCDDTAAAVVSAEGEILGESISSQTSTRFGGVIPSFSMGLHARDH